MVPRRRLARGADFIDGVPRGAQSLQLVTGGEGAGFVAGAGRLGRTRPLPIDVVVNCCHGGPGEDGTLQAALDLAGVAYTGPGVAGAALGMDKLAFAGVAQAAGLPVLPRVLLRQAVTGSGAAGDVGFPGPYILKPRFGGSSIGVEVVADLDTALGPARGQRPPARRGGRRALPRRPLRPERGRADLAAASSCRPSNGRCARPPRRRSSGTPTSTSGERGWPSAPRQLPADLAPPLVADALHDAARTVRARWPTSAAWRASTSSPTGTSLFVNEVNTVPGSLARYLWVDPPLPFIDLLDALIGEALARPAAHYSAAGADGTVLRSAGGIASKLA